MAGEEHVRAMTSKGQVTVPKEIRERLELQPGAMVRFTVEVDGQVTLSRAAPALESGYGAVPPISSPEDFQALRDAAVEEHVTRRFAGSETGAEGGRRSAR